MKKTFLLLCVFAFIALGFVSCSNGNDATSGSDDTTVSTPVSQKSANPFAGNTYKDLRPGREEIWIFTDKTVTWGTTEYKYEYDDTYITLKSKVNGAKVYDLEYSFNEDKTMLKIGYPIYAELTKQ